MRSFRSGQQLYTNIIMANSGYIPNTIKIGHIELDDDLRRMTDLIAKHAHDLWAQQRLSDGWTWGETRCDINKKHPCLVPYEELPDSEKIYDIQAAMGIIKAMMALGYVIRKSDKGEESKQQETDDIGRSMVRRCSPQASSPANRLPGQTG